MHYEGEKEGTLVNNNLTKVGYGYEEKFFAFIALVNMMDETGNISVNL
jgi:hypothetical protein